MNANVFNASLIVGWLLVLVGGVLLSPGLGLAVAGLLLIILALVAQWLAGGLYLPAAAAQDPDHKAPN